MRNTVRNERDEAETRPKATRPLPGLQWAVLALGIGMFLTGAVALWAGLDLFRRAMETIGPVR